MVIEPAELQFLRSLSVWSILSLFLSLSLHIRHVPTQNHPIKTRIFIHNGRVAADANLFGRRNCGHRWRCTDRRCDNALRRDGTVASATATIARCRGENDERNCFGKAASSGPASADGAGQRWPGELRFHAARHQTRRRAGPSRIRDVRRSDGSASIAQVNHSRLNSIFPRTQGCQLSGVLSF